MKTAVVYESTFGNTEQIAKVIADVLAELGPVQLLRAGQAKSLDLDEVQLLVIGSPTQKHSPSPTVQTWLAGLPRGTLQGVQAAAFDTRYRMHRFISGSAAVNIANLLRQKGARRVVPPERFFIAEKQGPLFEDELERAGNWARRILDQVGERFGVV